jgi:hypothetical protein
VRALLFVIALLIPSHALMEGLPKGPPSITRAIPLALPRGTPKSIVERGKRICGKYEGTKAATCMKGYARSYILSLTKRKIETEEQRLQRELGTILCKRQFVKEKQKACIEYYERQFLRTGRAQVKEKSIGETAGEEKLTLLEERVLTRQTRRLGEVPSAPATMSTDGAARPSLPIAIPEKQIWGRERLDWRRELRQALSKDVSAKRSAELFGPFPAERRAVLKRQLRLLEKSLLEESPSPAERRRQERRRTLELERQKTEDRRLVPLGGLEIYNPEAAPEE